MTMLFEYLRRLRQDGWSSWCRFWFTPSDPATLCLVRCLAGGMLLYTHLVWTIGLLDFFGDHAWINRAASIALRGDGYSWSLLNLAGNNAMLWGMHVAALLCFLCFALGLFSRVTAVLAFLWTVSYKHSAAGALFGLDQINLLLVTYLMLGPCGERYSLDALLKRGRGGEGIAPSVSANLAVRLIQVHMCVVYFFAGLGKLQGESWWVGDAMWLAFSNLEYQSWDMTWLSDWPVISAISSAIAVYWELSFCVLVWPRLLRPIVLCLAVLVHLGIGLCLGMMTFGLVMLIGCTAFIPAEFTLRLFSWRAGCVSTLFR